MKFGTEEQKKALADKKRAEAAAADAATATDTTTEGTASDNSTNKASTNKSRYKVAYTVYGFGEHNTQITRKGWGNGSTPEAARANAEILAK